MAKTEWPFLFPSRKRTESGIFNAKVGRQEILFRRIGANELDAIQVCRGFVEAQKEYASEIHDGSGVNQYAQRYYQHARKAGRPVLEESDGTSAGPIGDAVAKALAEGYHVREGGYPRLLLQNPEGTRPGGTDGTIELCDRRDHDWRLRSGCSPAEYRVTGVKTFVVNNDGIVYQKDLGPDSLEIVKKMELYNPDKTWQPTDD